ncbi:hypothetical protein DMH01_32685 [Amycolatopsis sp. WAC 04182]|uniref:WXG100 family type VII secretion target n=1 Tax=Amycolatopsis sp. WAC 04182 TaxID=2203198 RepID=UPI000F776BBE|nr:hypothetical protein [Amycolatopsis sp. WAC 04182]RSN55095.1 hypothetical protein DMH01_32685 [Amycolatopsis sp. WAC 04182]
MADPLVAPVKETSAVAGVPLLEDATGLKEALDALTGNADEVKAQAETWTNVAKELESVSAELTDLVKKDLQEWKGDAADAYGKRADDTSALIAGAEAIVAMRHPLADRVTVALVPAAWEREGKTGFRDRYFLEISSSRFAETLRSARTYSWDKAIERLSWFKDIDWEAARRRWTRGDFTKPE